MGGERRDYETIWQEYTSGKQTYNQLSKKHNCSSKTIQRIIDRVTIQYNKDFPEKVNIIMDTTYFGRGFGVMVFKDSITGNFLYKIYVKNETNGQYLAGLEQIRIRGIKIQSIVCDGRKGLLTLVDNIPIQMCQFHQIQIVNRYLTKKPKTQAAVELRTLSHNLSKVNKLDFEKALNAWETRWKLFLNERTSHEDTGKTFYTHKRLRSAWFSLKRNLKWLFVFEDYMTLKIPNTTNALDGEFSNLKNKLRNHNGLNKQRKIKFIDGFFKV